MAQEYEVLVRVKCDRCGGTGTLPKVVVDGKDEGQFLARGAAIPDVAAYAEKFGVPPASVRVKWVPCWECHGEGYDQSWVGIGTLKSLLM